MEDKKGALALILFARPHKTRIAVIPTTLVLSPIFERIGFE